MLRRCDKHRASQLPEGTPRLPAAVQRPRRARETPRNLPLRTVLSGNFHHRRDTSAAGGGATVLGVALSANRRDDLVATTATRPRASGLPGYRETWPCEALSAGRARSLVRAAIQAWNLDCLLDRGTLVVSELVANAVQHTNCELVRVSITLPSPHRVRITVSDTSGKLPKWHHRDNADDESGRGFTLVASAVDEWGVDLHPEGKTVWVELTTHDAPCTDEGA
ncbi:ATP-binding protein [Streptomyces buecherae]|uniref:ATP-binding protein n=1 Tax=Streptomyces buecherae TaxID=2763006 RepID=UPI003401AF08